MTIGRQQFSPKYNAHGTYATSSKICRMTSSFVSVPSPASLAIGGQANYAAANTFLHAFTQCRHQQGLPASVLDIGAMDDVGYVSQNAEVQQHFRSTAVYALHEPELLDSLHLTILRSAPPPRQVSKTRIKSALGCVRHCQCRLQATGPSGNVVCGWLYTGISRMWTRLIVGVQMRA